MREEEIDKKLESKLEVIDELFGRLMDVCRGEDRKERTTELLMQHEGKPYFDNLIGYAEVMLRLEYYERKRS